VGVTDWRDGVERLRASSPEHDLKPIMDALRPGQRLVMVTPIIFSMDRWNAPWTKLVRLRSAEFKQYASSDPRFAPTSVYPPFPRKEGPNPVEATVLLKTR